jgi:glycosyltransferase involved in cell wall biosynthesis
MERKMKKLNIAIVCDPLTHLTSGSMISTLRFAEHLKSRGNKIVFIAAKDEEGKSISYYKGFKIYRFLSFALPGSKGQYILSLPTKKKIIQILKDEKINIVHVIDPTPASIIGISAARYLGIKTIAHSHLQPENMCLQLPKILQSKKLKNFIYKYMIFIYKKVDAVICPSEFGKSMLRKYNKKIKLFVVSNGVNLSKFKKIKPHNFIKKYNLAEKSKKILYVGRLHMEKSVHTLIEAMPYILKEFKNAHLCIVGKGHLRENLEILAEKLNVKNNVTFFGKISDTDLLKAYNTCDIFVLPSIAELEGMVVLEAMACGKPIIISDSKLSASSDFVNGNGFVFKLQNPKDLAKKVLILLEDEAMMKRMGIKSFRNVKEYDINKSVDKLEKIYHLVLKD